MLAKQQLILALISKLKILFSITIFFGFYKVISYEIIELLVKSLKFVSSFVSKINF